jgi:hypothetical protein
MAAQQNRKIGKRERRVACLVTVVGLFLLVVWALGVRCFEAPPFFRDPYLYVFLRTIFAVKF